MALNLGPLNVLLRLQGAEKFKRETKDVTGGLDKLGKKIAGLLTIRAVGQQFMQATQVFAEFERGMVRVGAVTNSLGSEAFASLTERAKDLATTTEFTARQVADAMGFMGMAGMKTNQIFDATPAVLQLASAGMVDVAQAADVVTNIMAGYGIEAKDLTSANNTLVATFTSSNTSLQSLGQSFKYVGPVARAAGVQFKETAAVIGLMGNAGIQADMAGTALRGAIVKLLDPTAEGARIMRQYGINAVDSAGKLKPMVEIFRQLEPIADDSAKMIELFGLRAGPGMQAALAQGTGALESLIEKIDGAGDIAERISKAQLDTLDGKIKIMKSNAEALQIAIGKAFGPATTRAVEALATALGDVANAIENIGSRETAESVSNLAASLNPLLGLIRRLRTAADDLRDSSLGRAIRGFADNFIDPNTAYKRGSEEQLASYARRIAEARQELAAAEAGFLADQNDYDEVQRAAARVEKLEAALRRLRRELHLASVAQDTGMSTLYGMSEGRPTDIKGATPPTPKDVKVKVTAKVVGIEDVLTPGVGLALFGREFGDVIDPLSVSADEAAKAQARMGDAAADAAHKLARAGNRAIDFARALMSGQAGATYGPQIGATIGAVVDVASGGATGGLGASVGAFLGGLFGSALDELVASLGVLTPLFEIVGDVLKAFSAPLIVLKAMFETLRDAVGIGLIPIFEMLASTLAKPMHLFLVLIQALMPWIALLVNASQAIMSGIIPAFDLLYSALTVLTDQAIVPFARASIMAYNALADFVNGLITALREFEIAGAKPFESFGVLMSKLDPDTVQTYLDLISDENEARSEAAQGLREFNEELRNVPIGVKRIRGLQFTATSGRFNSPAWGA